MRPPPPEKVTHLQYDPRRGRLEWRLDNGRVERTPMALEPVESSSIGGVGYDRARRLLVLEFRSHGRRYCYWNVPAWLAEALRGAKSIGRFVNAVIKDERRFPYREIDMDWEALR